jgi:uncharacterized phage protein (TIGR01671 family)
MNREIKFRGLRTDGKGWVYGYLLKDVSRVFIYTINTSFWLNHLQKEDETYQNQARIFVDEVHPESVGQFTGLKDVNGVDIYEGDILENSAANFFVTFEKGVFGVRLIKEEPYNIGVLALRNCQNIKVIGNIHEQNEKL